MLVPTILMASLRSSVTAMTARLVDLADTDPLTGLLNRRGLTARVTVMLDQACSFDVSLQACLVDIDHFKSVDDDFGHAIGDDVLVEVAATLHAVAGPDAVVARLGGEEFPVLGLVPSMGGVEGNRTGETRLRKCSPNHCPG
ncbi:MULTISPECIES: GGDEF domain-containing protein [unclassified Rhodococcus (in: high G+C Gram-positive bacteria)]|uniref:GGDEF domain-containing protein n=1 Tax=unclassified Rhodococcus (in: high G+C Gram-positive bacteria) TaxID=192944 RepID=UPI001C9A4C5E|nr:MULTISPECIES: GGDEF domain-containing protein [unclassified Rhodococcus (in: high G+C Gram-positive bacteria)]